MTSEMPLRRGCHLALTGGSTEGVDQAVVYSLLSILTAADLLSLNRAEKLQLCSSNLFWTPLEVISSPMPCCQEGTTEPDNEVQPGWRTSLQPLFPSSALW